MDGPTELTDKVIGAAIAVHRALGPGLLESAYEVCLAHELSLMGMNVSRQVECSVNYRGIQLNTAYRLDLLVEDRLVVELKAVDRLAPIHMAQVLTYLRLRGEGVGLLLNFNTIRMSDGVRRVIYKPALARHR
jgi:GxxExxY protein